MYMPETMSFCEVYLSFPIQIRVRNIVSGAFFSLKGFEAVLCEMENEFFNQFLFGNR